MTCMIKIYNVSQAQVLTTLRIFIDFGFYREIEKKAGLLSIKNR